MQPRKLVGQKRKNQWNRTLTPTEFIEHNFARKATTADFERAYAKKSGRALRDITRDAGIGETNTKRLFRTENMTLHTHPTYSYKPSGWESLGRLVGMELGGTAIRNKTAAKGGSGLWLAKKLEKSRRKNDYQRIIPSPKDLTKFFSKSRVKTDAIIAMDPKNPRKVAGYLFMRKINRANDNSEKVLRTNIRRTMVEVKINDLNSSNTIVKEKAITELTESYPYLFKHLKEPLIQSSITTEYMKGMIEDLRKLGIQSRLVPNRKKGYEYYNGQFVKK